MELKYFLIFTITYVLRNLLEIFIQPRSVTLTTRRDINDAISLTILVAGHFLAGISICYYLLTDNSIDPIFYSTGLVIFLTGFAGRIISLKVLGKNYSKNIQCPVDSFLVKTGPYSVIRHPMYLFYIIEMTGFLIIRFNAISLASLILVVLAVIYRIESEEKILQARFSAEFEQYSKSTKKIIPFIC